MALIKLRKELSDIEFVTGVYSRDSRIERALYLHCKRYFDEKHRGLFSVDDESKDDIFQEAFITLWENILTKRIYVSDGVLIGSDGKAFRSRLTTYFMSIAHLKYLESRRRRWQTVDDTETECQQNQQSMAIYEDEMHQENDDMMQIILDDCMQEMPNRCTQILTMFYHQKMSLDDIMRQVPEFESKDALKTRKYKCMKMLRDKAEAIYHSYRRRL